MSRNRPLESLDYLLAQICRLHFQRAVELLEEIGLYRGQPMMLYALWENEGLTQTELAEILKVTPATTTKMLQRMERTGFLIRQADPADQRISRVYLTDAGRAIRDKVEAVWQQMEAETFGGLTQEEHGTLKRTFLSIYANLMRVTGGKIIDPALLRISKGVRN